MWKRTTKFRLLGLQSFILQSLAGSPHEHVKAAVEGLRHCYTTVRLSWYAGGEPFGSVCVRRARCFNNPDESRGLQYPGRAAGRSKRRLCKG